jgi:hypothetical protein
MNLEKFFNFSSGNKEPEDNSLTEVISSEITNLNIFKLLMFNKYCDKAVENIKLQLFVDGIPYTKDTNAKIKEFVNNRKIYYLQDIDLDQTIIPPDNHELGLELKAFKDKNGLMEVASNLKIFLLKNEEQEHYELCSLILKISNKLEEELSLDKNY